MDKSRCSLMTFTLDIDVAMRKLSVKEILLLAKNAGISLVDVQNLSPQSLQAYRHASEEAGVRTHCYIGHVSFFSIPEETVRRELQKHLKTAAALDAKLFMIVPLNVVRDKKICAKLDTDQIRQRLKKYFTMAVELAEGTGIHVCFETTPHEFSRLSGIEDCRWVLEQVPNLGLVFDTANMLSHGDDPVEYYEQLKEYMVHIHVKDVAVLKPRWKHYLLPSEWTKEGQIMQCCVFGQGVIPLKEILRRMEKDGYQGIYALEYCHPEKYPASLEHHVHQMKPHMAFLQSL